MNFLRNPEIRRQIYLYAAFTILSGAVGFVIGVPYGFAFLGISIFYDLAMLFTTWRRYRRIAELGREIDRILHGCDAVRLSEYAEGELSILQNEVYKLTIRFREQAEALLSDKATLADALADISHQIRTPLTSIRLLATFLSEPELTDEKRAEFIRELNLLLSRIDWLISTLLKISKLDAGTVRFQSEPVPLADLIRRAFEPIEVPMELRNLRKEIDLAGGETFQGDMAWSVEAIGNILKNCMEHTPSGGAIRVSGSENRLYTEIVIRDTGCGIDPSDLPHLFERFYKGKDSSDQNVGIGLALARIVAARQNGTVKAENGKDGGAVFTVRFYKSVV